MTFRFYITDLFDGSVKGTDDEEKAVALSAVDEFFVIDTQTNEFIVSADTRPKIEEWK